MSINTCGYIFFRKKRCSLCAAHAKVSQSHRSCKWEGNSKPCESTSYKTPNPLQNPKKDNNVKNVFIILITKIVLIIRKQKKTLEYVPWPPEINLKEMTCSKFDPIQCFTILYLFFRLYGNYRQFKINSLTLWQRKEQQELDKGIKRRYDISYLLEEV